MNNNIRILFTFLLLTATTQAAATSNSPYNTISNSEQRIVKKYNAINPLHLRISLNNNLHGVIESKTCIFCKTIKINITPETKAYANNIKVPLAQAKGRTGHFATVIYELKTNKVSEIHW